MKIKPKSHVSPDFVTRDQKISKQLLASKTKIDNLVRKETLGAGALPKISDRAPAKSAKRVAQATSEILPPSKKRKF